MRQNSGNGHACHYEALSGKAAVPPISTYIAVIFCRHQISTVATITAKDTPTGEAAIYAAAPLSWGCPANAATAIRVSAEETP